MLGLEKALRKIIEKSSRRIVSTLALEHELQGRLGRNGQDEWSYESFARAMEKLVEEGLIVPVKASGYNGRIPPLAVRYRRIARPVSPPPELFHFRSQMDLSYFARRPQEFYRYQDILQAIDRYLVGTAQEKPSVWDTLNERSFQLTGDEKFLDSAEGADLLRRIQVSHEDLHCYPVAEPFFYRLLDDRIRQAKSINVLVIENKDSFHTFCCLLGEGSLILRPPVSLAIYGEGNKICGSWPFFNEIPGPASKQIRAYYYGDLDPMGLIILQRWQKAVQRAREENRGNDLASALEILPAQGLYRALLQQGRDRELKIKAEGLLPAADLELLWTQFAPELRRSIEELWARGRMVPQEALSASRLAELKEITL